MTNCVDPDQTVCSVSTLFASILDSQVILGDYLQQTTSADDIFRMHFFLGALRVKCVITGSSGHIGQFLLFLVHITQRISDPCTVYNITNAV